MKVKILKSTRNSYWYNNDIGKIFEISYITDDFWFKVKPSGNWIRKSDCVDVKEYREEKLKRILK